MKCVSEGRSVCAEVRSSNWIVVVTESEGKCPNTASQKAKTHEILQREKTDGLRCAPPPLCCCSLSTYSPHSPRPECNNKRTSSEEDVLVVWA